MEVKDYYRILDLEPSATVPEIKKAYRKLALQYHPDKANNDLYTTAHFTEIKEAYEVLTNPAKKEYYLQQRWYNQSTGKKFSRNETVTPPSVLKQCLELNRYVSSLDTHRMDREGLTQYIREIISDSTIHLLKNFNEPAVNREIITTLLNSATALQLHQIKSVALQLFRLADDDITSKQHIAAVIDQHRKKEKRAKYQPLMIILITLIICLLIYLVSR